MKSPEPPESKHKKLHVTKNRKTWFDERQKAKMFGCAWPSKKLPRGDHAEVTPIPPPPPRPNSEQYHYMYLRSSDYKQSIPGYCLIPDKTPTPPVSWHLEYSATL